MLRNSLVIERLVAYQEGPSSMELVIISFQIVSAWCLLRIRSALLDV
jgi:hypothetical protein